MQEALNDPSSLLSLSGLSSSETESLRRTIFDAYHNAFHTVFLIMAGLSAFAGLMAIFLMPQIRLEDNNAADAISTTEDGVEGNQESQPEVKG